MKYLVSDSDLICGILISKLVLIIPHAVKRGTGIPKALSFRQNIKTRPFCSQDLQALTQPSC